MSHSRMTRRQALQAMSLAGAALPLVASCRARRGEPGTLTVLINAEPGHLDPRYPADALGATIARLVYAPLLVSDPHTFEPIAGLAESVEQLAPTVVRARLRPGLRFHDGSPLGARDVEWTFRSLLDPALRSTVRGTYVKVFERVRALDALTVEFVLTGADGTYPSLLQQPILRAQDTTHTELLAVAGNESRFVGSGAMRVTSLEQGAWEFERVQPVPGRARRIRFLSMQDPNTLALRLLHGDADLAEIKPELFPLFADRADFTVSSARSVGFTYLGLRNDHVLLGDASVRRAIARAIDRNSLRVGKFGSYAIEARGPLPPTHWAYEPNVETFDYAPAMARTLLRDVAARQREALVLRTSNVRMVVTVAHAIAEICSAKQASRYRFDRATFRRCWRISESPDATT